MSKLPIKIELLKAYQTFEDHTANVDFWMYVKDYCREKNDVLELDGVRFFSGEFENFLPKKQTPKLTCA